MFFEGLLPNGTVIKAEKSNRKFMIIGNIFQDADGNMFDYAACIYPEGLINADEIYYFNNDDIEKVYFIGYQDGQQMAFQKEEIIALEKYKNEKESKK